MNTRVRNEYSGEGDRPPHHRLDLGDTNRWWWGGSEIPAQTPPPNAPSRNRRPRRSSWATRTPPVKKLCSRAARSQMRHLPSHSGLRRCPERRLPSFAQPPIVEPPKPGVTFSPPPVFNPRPSGGAGSGGAKPATDVLRELADNRAPSASRQSHDLDVVGAIDAGVNEEWLSG